MLRKIISRAVPLGEHAGRAPRARPRRISRRWCAIALERKTRLPRSRRTRNELKKLEIAPFGGLAALEFIDGQQRAVGLIVLWSVGAPFL